MYGAILGDIIGSPFEFDRGGKTKDFPLFSFAFYVSYSCRSIAILWTDLINRDMMNEI